MRPLKAYCQMHIEVTEIFCYAETCADSSNAESRNADSSNMSQERTGK